MDWHNVTELQPTPSQTVTIFTKEGRTISGQTWDNDSRSLHAQRTGRGGCGVVGVIHRVIHKGGMKCA